MRIHIKSEFRQATTCCPVLPGHQGQNSGRSSDVLYCQDIKIIRSSDVVLYSWSESRQVTTCCPVLPGRQGQNSGRSPHVALYCQDGKVRIQAGHHMLPCIARTSRSESRQVTTCCPVLPGRQGQNSGRSPHVALYWQDVKVRIQADHQTLFCIRGQNSGKSSTAVRYCRRFVRPQGVVVVRRSSISRSDSNRSSYGVQKPHGKHFARAADDAPRELTRG